VLIGRKAIDGRGDPGGGLDSGDSGRPGLLALKVRW